MRVLVFNGWAASPEVWSLTTFRRDWTFDYIEQLDGMPERIIADFSDVVLVGFSMGGNTILRLLPTVWAKVRGLVFVSTTPRMMEDKSSGWAGLSERRLAALRLGTQIAYRGNPSPIYAVRNMDRGLEYLRESDQRMPMAEFASRVDLTSVPVSVFHSVRDGIVRPHNAEWLKSIFPQADVTLVPGGEHVLPVQVPELIDAAIEKYSIIRPSA